MIKRMSFEVASRKPSKPTGPRLSDVVLGSILWAASMFGLIVGLFLL